MNMKSFFLQSHRRWLMGIILLAGGGAFLLDKILRTTTCPAQFDTACEHYTDVLFAFDSGFFLKSLILSSILLFFLPARAFNWWRWFALIAIPVGIWDIATTKFGSGMPVGSPYDASNIDGDLFLGATIIIAFLATLHTLILRHAEKKANQAVVK
ncbi:MAG: hypothetical protein WC878_07590 [Candidatus Paceibacterota bacterium]